MNSGSGTKEGPSVKNDASFRSVSVHPQIIDLGFLDYFKAMKKIRCHKATDESDQNQQGVSKKILKLALWATNMEVLRRPTSARSYGRRSEELPSRSFLVLESMSLTAADCKSPSMGTDPAGGT